MEAIINGKSQKSAALGASKAFIAAFDALAKDGKSLKVNDPACAAASKAFHLEEQLVQTEEGGVPERIGRCVQLAKLLDQHR